MVPHGIDPKLGSPNRKDSPVWDVSTISYEYRIWAGKERREVTFLLSDRFFMLFSQEPLLYLLFVR